MEFNLADLFEAVCDAVADRPAVVGDGRRLTFAELDRRANELAHGLAARGIGDGDRVALALRDQPTYLEAMLGAFKVRAVAVNVNRHYVVEELRAVMADAEPALVVGEPELAGRAASGDGRRRGRERGAAYEALLAGQPTARPTVARSGDDGFLLYTGGTTGRPKGVLWRHEDLFFAALGGGNLGGGAVERPEDVVLHLSPEPARTAVASPLMHGTAQWAALATLLAGSTVLLAEAASSGFAADAVLDLVARERASHLVVVGDAFALPLADALDAEPERWALDSLVVVASGGAALSDAVALRLLAHLPGAVVVDGYGSSETGGQGRRVISPGTLEGGPPRYVMGSDTTVLGDDRTPVAPGSGQVGRLARCGHVPLGYRNDPGRTEQTFPLVDGVRWAITNDLARIEADGTITVLGRSERVINSGGEKIYPAEVEAAVLGHPDVRDAVVVAVPDTRFGEAVGAIVRLAPGTDVTLDQLQEHCRPLLARFKLPRQLLVVEEIRRLATGKVDLHHASSLFAAAGPA